MPQLDLFWWGFNFFISWSFLLVSFIYFTKMKFVSVYSVNSFSFSGNSYGFEVYEWLW